MGKKHKKHHKADKADKMTVDEEKPTPLKIVLKVGGATTAIPETSTDAISSEYHEGERRHKHKKKKKKKSSDKEKHRHGEHGEEKSEKHKKDRKRERSQIEVTDAPVEAAAPPSKRVLVMEPEPFETLGTQSNQPRKSEFGTSQLQACLDYLHKQLQRKDVNGFFAFPVTDNIAPGYSSIIHHPMDFSTMKTKIENHEYQNVSEYKKDFKLMCDNCITYNRPETVYYKESKRLLSIGTKLMSKEKLIMMKKSLSFMATISNEELGIDDEEANTILAGGTTEPTPKPPKSKPKSKPKPSKFEAIPDNLTPEEILAAAREAAKDAADELTLRKPKSKIGFLRRRPDGTTTLNILNPDNDGIVSEKERIVDLGTLTGKLTSGTGNIAGFKEDKRNKANPVNYLNYGPYSSFAPSYDSSFSNVSKEDTDLLLSTYGDETGLQYALSLKNFVENAGYSTNVMVDSLLNVLTGNEHSKANQLLQQRKKEAQDMVRLAEERKEAEDSGRHSGDDVDFDSLRNLSAELGIDMSFLDAFERNYKPAPRSEEESRIDAKLQETSQLIRDLQKTQNERLSRKLPVHLANIPKPSEKEVKLAEKVTQQLTELTKEAMPAEIVSVSALRKAMGVALAPTEGDDQSESDGIEEIMDTTPAPIENNMDDPSYRKEPNFPQKWEKQAITVMMICTRPQNEESHRRPFQQLHCQSNDVKVPEDGGGSSVGFPDPAQLPLSDIASTSSFKFSVNTIKTEPHSSRGTTTPISTTRNVVDATAPTTSSVMPPSAEIPAELSEVLGSEIPSVSDQDIEQDLAEFLDTGPLLQACQSPSLSAAGGLDPVDLM